MKLVFATNNKNKIKEIKNLIGHSIQLLSLADIGCKEEIPETANTLRGNALQKARYVYDNFGYNCFADDTGLEIEALDGRPGVYSARYAGIDCNAEDNMDKVLNELQGESNRNAQFKTVITLIIDGEITFFEGCAKGKITTQKSGVKGFGYDPIFKPEGYTITFSEMNLEKKNKVSHRGKAVSKLTNMLAKNGH